jgi:hypothetical protein
MKPSSIGDIIESSIFGTRGGVEFDTGPESGLPLRKLPPVQPGTPMASRRNRRVRSRGGSVKRFFIGALTLAIGTLMMIGNESSIAKDQAKSWTMRFDWRTEGPSDRCGENCRTWISATGTISDRTVRDFELFSQKSDLRGATLVLDSEGGSVLATLAVGRLIRSLGMTTSVGKTKLLSSSDGDSPRAVLEPGAKCESMCAFMLLAGVRRYVPREAHVLVHQIWLASKREADASYSGEELRLVQRDIGSLAAYTVEMGGDIGLIETALRVPPWEPLYELSVDELRRMRVSTVDELFDRGIPIASMTVESPTNPISIVSPATAAHVQRGGE